MSRRCDAISWGKKTGKPSELRRWRRRGEDCLKTLLGISRAIDRFNTQLGRIVAWAILIAVLVSAANAVIRKVFNTSSNAWLELQWVLFGIVFLLCAPWTLLSNEHIRIDIVNNMFPKRLRDWIDVFGHVFFLIPVAVVVAYLGWPFFWISLVGDEQSTNAGGLPVYPSKLLIPLGFSLLAVQGISELIKRIAIINGDLPEDHLGGGHPAAASAAGHLEVPAIAAGKPDASSSANER
jgi:TRAP-type mannitol/chloroaromatic compound transport system permease small subunit